ncbi:MAG: tRNA (adenosine(37)-N6)-threonylcarbamoyltransferase complex ATPase subunit type 1 TsaE [Chitinophagaceae bacterium]
MEFIYTLKEIQQAAQWIIQLTLKLADCIAFYAPMGAGKTSLIRALGIEYQVIDNVNSPTFSIINEYKTKDGKKIYHMDWYRLQNEQDAEQAGVLEVLESNALKWIEWPQQAEGLLPLNTMKFSIEIIDEHTRKLIKL